MNRASFGGILLIFALCGPAEAQPLSSARGDTLDPLPPWDYGEMVGEVLEPILLHPAKDVSVRLLSWCRQEDDRPWVVEMALLWVEERSGKDHRWHMAMVARNPGVAKHERWVTAFIFDATWQPVVTFNRPPTRADVQAFVSGRPGFCTEPYMTVVAQGTRERTWDAIFGPAKLPAAPKEPPN